MMVAAIQANSAVAMLSGPGGAWPLGVLRRRRPFGMGDGLEQVLGKKLRERGRSVVCM